MAILSNLYSEKEVKTVNGVNYSLTDSVKNLWGANEKIDNSIVYTKCSANSLKTSSIDIDTGKNINVLVKKSTTAYPQEYVFNLMYSPEYSMQNVNIGYCLTYGQSSDFWNGFNPDKQTTSGTGGNTQFLRDFKINNIVFSVDIMGYNVSDLNNIFTNPPENIQISLDDLVKNPESYLISGITFSNPVIFKKTETNTYEKTTNANIKIAVINMAEKSTGINFVEKICRHESFASNSPLTINLRSTNMDGNIGVTGGSHNTLYYDLSKWYGCDTVKDFNIDFPEIDLTQYKETKEFDLGYYELSNNSNSVIYGKKSVKIGYTASTDTARINNAFVKLYRLLKGQFVVNLLAGAGVYMNDFTHNIPDNINPENFYADPNIYLGEMDKNGLTTGKFISGTELLTYDGWNKDGTTNNPDFNPNISSNGDDIDDMPLGYDILDNGMIKYYQITVGDLVKVATVISNMSYSNTIKTVWDTLNSTTETDKLDSILNTLRTWGVSADNLMPSIVSLKSFGISTSNFLAAGGTKPESIVLNGVDCETNTVRILASSMAYHIGDYTINGKYGDALNPHFLDYSPYTQMEIYIPYCGTVELPSKCMYNTINVYLLGDIFSGSCVGVVKCNGAIVATKSGMIGVDTPLTSNGNGLKSNALMTGVMNSIGIGAQTILSGAMGNMGGIISGATTGMSNISQQIQAGNGNYTRMIGNVSDKCAWALPHQATIKIVHPIPNYGENYERTYGKPVCKSRTLAEGDGFTIVDNPIINGNMTLAEKTEIENYLRSGVIL